ncbi:MAG: hypothetical protein JWM72_4496 [Actinomycetia bacterium]|jgi:hypothetical protein|nr:hypothetical protein [Actinomycetes bacterium]
MNCVAETGSSGVEIATEYWDLRLAFWRSFSGALGLRSIALLIFTIGLPGSSLRQAIAVVLFGALLFTVWAGLFPRAAAVVLTIVVAIVGFGGPLVAIAQRDPWLLLSVPFDLLSFVLARRAVPVAKPYKLARRRARHVRRDVRIRAGGGM